MADEDLAQRLLAAYEDFADADQALAAATDRRNAAAAELTEVQREIRQRRLIRG